MWSIRVLSGSQIGKIFDLKFGKNVFGRGGQSDFKILSVGISKEHCEIHVYKEKIMLVDLKSSNGTFVNGVKIQNSLIRVGDKISLFDVIFDLIPTPDIRPKKALQSQTANQIANQAQFNKPQNFSAQQSPVPSPQMGSANHYPQSFPQVLGAQGNQALQMSNQGLSHQSMQTLRPYQTTQNPMSQNQVSQNQAPQLEKSKDLKLKIEEFIENALMPGIYKLGIIFSFKQVLLAFVILFVFSVTLLSMIPLTAIVKDSNLIEAKKRARSVARGMAKLNEQALLSGQLSNLTVQDALKEEGIKEAFIIQQSDGGIVAPSEKAGREMPNSFILKARQESRATLGEAGNGLIGASHPIGVYDPSTGEPTVKYHAIVLYDISSLSLDNERVISLFMQTLIIASVLGLMLYFLFARFIEFPIRRLNQEIDKALMDKTDQTEVPFDYPLFQKLVSNVNTLLNRVWNADSSQSNSSLPQNNKDIEFSNLVEMISHPALVIDNHQRIVAVNNNLTELIQSSPESLLNQSYQVLPDSALVQNIDSLIVRSQQSPFEKQIDKIPFSQFECHIYCQAFSSSNSQLSSESQPEYYIMTLVKAEG